MRARAAALALGLFAGCKYSPTFTCETAAECGVGARCEVDGLCSFSDGTCASGYRYGEYSGELSGVCVGDEPGPDAQPGDAPVGCAQWQTHHFDACAIPAPFGDLTITGHETYDSTTDTYSGGTIASIVVSQAGGVDARLLAVGNLTIAAGASLTLTGSLPVIVAVSGSARLDGLIDASSGRGRNPGAGSNPGLCATMAAAVGEDHTLTSGGSGGGGGGAFQGAGGTGGIGDSPPAFAGGLGGVASLGPPVVVRGGCDGAASGLAGPAAQTPATPSSISLPGRGGGAVQLTARDNLVIGAAGVVAAGGGGGDGSPSGSSCGGGGGGAGGYVGLEAGVVLEVQGVLAANGGGGGASQGFAAGPGLAGGDGSATATPAAGGAMNTCATAGGIGSAGAALDGASVTATLNCGGGGGGGAAGFILVWAPTPVITGTVSPPELRNP